MQLRNILARGWTIGWFLTMLLYLRIVTVVVRLVGGGQRALIALSVGMYLIPRAALSERLFGFVDSWHINHARLEKVKADPSGVRFSVFTWFEHKEFASADVYFFAYAVGSFVVGDISLMPKRHDKMAVKLCRAILVVWMLHVWQVLLQLSEWNELPGGTGVSPTCTDAVGRSTCVERVMLAHRNVTLAKLERPHAFKDNNSRLAISFAANGLDRRLRSGGAVVNAAMKEKLALVTCCRAISSDFANNTGSPYSAVHYAMYNPFALNAAVLCAVSFGAAAAALVALLMSRRQREAQPSVESTGMTMDEVERVKHVKSSSEFLQEFHDASKATYRGLLAVRSTGDDDSDDDLPRSRRPQPMESLSRRVHILAIQLYGVMRTAVASGVICSVGRPLVALSVVSLRLLLRINLSLKMAPLEAESRVEFKRRKEENERRKQENEHRKQEQNAAEEESTASEVAKKGQLKRATQSPPPPKSLPPPAPPPSRLTSAWLCDALDLTVLGPIGCSPVSPSIMYWRAVSLSWDVTEMVAWAALMPAQSSFISRGGSRAMLPYLLHHTVQIRPVVEVAQRCMMWSAAVWPLVLPTICFAAFVVGVFNPIL